MNEDMKNTLLLVYHILDELDEFYETHYAYDIPIQGDKLIQLAKMNYQALELMYEVKEKLGSNPVTSD